MSSAFNARLVSNWTPDRLYRVYVVRDEMFFIRIGGQGGFAQGMAAQFGLLGLYLLKAYNRRSAAKLAAKIAELDRISPSIHLSAHKHNFHVGATGVERSSLEAPPVLGAHGEHCGRWRLKLRDAKEWLFQLETPEDMTAAHELLSTLGCPHVSKVVWDAAKKRFVTSPA
jgi:hypothetical protein